VIVEYAPHGNLRDFLRDRRPSAEYQRHQHAASPSPSSSPASAVAASAITTHSAAAASTTGLLTYNDLVSFGYQVARGVDYLASKLVRSHHHHRRRHRFICVVIQQYGHLKR